jgi:NADH dehydrogenase/NADH:ubiquinone oxidoreductase subunit G
MSTNYIPVTINKRLHLVPQNFLIIQACEQAFYNIPRFCYHENLSVAGNCRRCLVEVHKSPKPVKTWLMLGNM